MIVFRQFFSKYRQSQKKINFFRRFEPVVPFIFTFANALFGFISIIKTIEGDFYMAAWCIMIAAVMDGIDGRIARYFGVNGELGGELDSLCDAISFCLAPAVLLYSWFLHDFDHPILFVPVLALYLCAGLFRLARFNILDQDDSHFFFGLPTTIAAFFLAVLVVYQEWVAGGPLQFILKQRVMIGLIASIALLMISSFRFPTFKETRLLRVDKDKKRYVFGPSGYQAYLRIAVLAFIFVWCVWHGYPLVFLMVGAYITGSLFLDGFGRIKKILSR